MALTKWLHHLSAAWYSKRDPVWIKRMNGVHDIIDIGIEEDETETACEYSIEWPKLFWNGDGKVEYRVVVGSKNMALVNHLYFDLNMIRPSVYYNPADMVKTLVAMGYEDRTPRLRPEDAIPQAVALSDLLGDIRSFSDSHKNDFLPWKEDEETSEAYLLRAAAHYSNQRMQLQRLTAERDRAYNAIRRAIYVIEKVVGTYENEDNGVFSEANRWGVLQFANILLNDLAQRPLEVDDPEDIPF